MALPIEGYAVVAQFSRIKGLLEAGSVVAPNGRVLSDGHLWLCSFMAEADALKFVQTLEGLGLNGSSGPDSDVVRVREFDRAVEPYCEWLKTTMWEKAVIGWKADTPLETVTAHAGWDPKVGSGLEFHNRSTMDTLEFLRLEGNVEVYRNKETGKEVYIGRTSTPVEALFQSAAKIVQKHFVNPGERAVTGEAAAEVAGAVEMLDKVLVEAPGWWNAQWYCGKARQALGEHEKAYAAFRAAYQIDKTQGVILREYGGACLEVRRFAEAVEMGEAAVALDPRNVELLGNLAVAYLLAGRTGPARKAIDAALKVKPDDGINRTIANVIAEVETGRREPPQSLRDMAKPAAPKKRSFFPKWWPWGRE